MQIKILRDDIEYSVHCEKDGTVIGPLSKDHAHMDGVRESLTHYSTWSMIYNFHEKKYGIQLKNPARHDKYNAGRWDMGVAGHNQYIEDGEGCRYLSFEENLIKEAEEEIGLKVKMVETLEEFLEAVKNFSDQSVGFIFDKFHYQTEVNNEYVGLGFVLTPTTDVEFVDDEVMKFQWMASEELRNFVDNNDNYCDPLPLVFDKAEKFRQKYLSN